MNLHFIHGFLGQANDWSAFEKDFSNYTVKLHRIETYLPNALEKQNQFATWSQNFNSTITTSHKNILIGYSLGGRLALHAFFNHPDLWDGIILISTHPGLIHQHDKELRMQNDQKWATKFAQEPWKEVLSAWNQQGVFADFPESFERQKENYHIDTLQSLLLGFSLAKQENLRSQIKNTEKQMLWLAGEKDQKFCQLLIELSDLNSKHKYNIIKNCGHRVPWENKQMFVEICKEYLLTLDK